MSANEIADIFEIRDENIFSLYRERYRFPSIGKTKKKTFS